MFNVKCYLSCLILMKVKASMRMFQIQFYHVTRGKEYTYYSGGRGVWVLTNRGTRL